jgi:hypothetical protein
MPAPDAGIFFLRITVLENNGEARLLSGQNVPVKLNFLNCFGAAALPT